MDDAPAAAGSHDDAEDQLFTLAGAVKRLGHGEAIRVVLHSDFAAEHQFEVGFQRPSVQADGVGILHHARARRNRPRGADPEGVWRAMNALRKFAVKFLNQA